MRRKTSGVVRVDTRCRGADRPENHGRFPRCPINQTTFLRSYEFLARLTAS